jgi:DNA-binding MarR family transcriptional regulator
MSRNATQARSAAAVSRAQRSETAPASGQRRRHEPEASEAGPAPRRARRPAADRVLQQFRIILNAVKTHFQQVERRSGIGGVQVWALSLIHERPGLGVGQLAVALNVRQPTASSVVRNLALQGLIEARREGPDRRSVQLHATAAGGELLRRAPGPHAGLLPEALGALDKHTLGQLETCLQTLVDRLGADGRAAKQPLSQL